MKYLFVFLIACIITSCKDDSTKGTFVPEEKTDYVFTEGDTPELSPSAKIGQEIFDGKGKCFSCHKPDQKIIGPSIAEIAKIYKEKNGNMVEFLKGNGEPIVDPSQYEVMKTNFAITKNLSDEELKGLEDYMYSH